MKSRLPLLLLLVCVVAFGFGLFRLFKLRFDRGDVYPAYSSLRADPLGTMVLCESLERMPGVTVTRDYSSANRLPQAAQSTYLHLAAEPEAWLWVREDIAGEIDRFVRHGGRLAITFYPQTSTAFSPMFSPRFASTNASGAKKTHEGPEEQREVSIRERWGVEFGFIPLPRGEEDNYSPVSVRNRSGLDLPATLDWHSALVLTNLGESWKTIYARGSSPVVVERKLGLGTIVIATDSFFLSNEAMLTDRHADLLSWLAGPNPQIVFDEAHLGTVESPGVGLLIRKYRLYWLVGALLLLAGLFIWRNSMSFVPPVPEEASADCVAGQHAASGFVKLLRRNIPPRDLLRTCFDEWTRSLTQGTPHSLARVDQAQAVVESEAARLPRERDPIRAYQEVVRALKGKR